jgi:hypothetical protein
MNPRSCVHLIFDKHMMEKSQPLQQMLLEKVVICLEKTETRSMIHACHPVLVSTQSELRTLISDLKT